MLWYTPNVLKVTTNLINNGVSSYSKYIALHAKHDKCTICHWYTTLPINSITLKTNMMLFIVFDGKFRPTLLRVEKLNVYIRTSWTCTYNIMWQTNVLIYDTATAFCLENINLYTRTCVIYQTCTRCMTCKNIKCIL